MTDARKPILLGGYAAKQCPVRTHNDFAPVVPAPECATPAELQALFDAGRQFEDEVFAELLRLHPGSAVLVDSRSRGPDAIRQTVSAMRSGAPLILGGWLPDDEAGGRSGKPDVLVKVDGGYLPADVKHHKTVDPAKKTSIRMSGLARPAAWWDAPGLTAGAHHYEDSLQLAHYTRMLQACGFHPGEDVPLGAVIGTSRLAVPGGEPALVFVWYDLSRKTRPTFSRSRGKVKRSVLESYDHEHGFRVTVAATALRITGSAADPDPLVVPIGQKECGECPYELFCAEQMGPDDASATVTRAWSRRSPSRPRGSTPTRATCTTTSSSTRVGSARPCRRRCACASSSTPGARPTTSRCGSRGRTPAGPGSSSSTAPTTATSAR